MDQSSGILIIVLLVASVAGALLTLGWLGYRLASRFFGLASANNRLTTSLPAANPAEPATTPQSNQGTSIGTLIGQVTAVLVYITFITFLTGGSQFIRAFFDPLMMLIGLTLTIPTVLIGAVSGYMFRPTRHPNLPNLIKVCLITLFCLAAGGILTTVLMVSINFGG
jgi:hypothetical protein